MQIEKRMERLKKSKARDPQSKTKEEAEKSALEKIQQALMDGKPARSVSLTESEEEAVKHLCLLTMKPVIYVANVAESDLAEPGNNPHVKEVMNLASELQSRVVTISAQGQLAEFVLLEKKQTETPKSRVEPLKQYSVGEQTKPSQQHQN